MSKSSRNSIIDNAKLICLMLMVFCHIPLPEGRFHEVVYSFHMPFFFFVGGLFYKPERFIIKKGMQTLVLPYIFFNLLIVLLNTCVELISHSFCGESFVKGLGGMLSGSSCTNPIGSLPSGPSWFLVAFFLVKYSAKYILKCRLGVQAAFIIIPVFVVLLFRKHWSWCLWSIDSAVLGSVFFYIAYYLKDRVLPLLNNTRVVWLLFATFPLCCFSWVNGQADMYACTWGNCFLLYVIFAVIGIFSVLLIGKAIKIPQIFLKNMMDGSIFVICMNIFIIDYACLFIRKVFPILGDFLWYHKLIITTVVFFCTCLCTPIFMRYCPWILGKRNVE